MTGPEHYREAERLVGEVVARVDLGGVSADAANYNLAVAQVHATLALVAATVSTPGRVHPDSGRAQEWMNATS